MGYSLIILAAGQGTRMQSSIPKVLHKLAARPILLHCLSTVAKISSLDQIIIVAGQNITQLQSAINNNVEVNLRLPENIIWAYQDPPLGTADAVKIGLAKVPQHINNVLILSGDVPLISADILNKLVVGTPEAEIGMITANVIDPEGFGRVVRDQNNNFVQIIEETDASDLQKSLTEINAGIYLFPKEVLVTFLPQISNNNQQREYYFPQIFDFVKQHNIAVHTYSPKNNLEIMGVNTREQLAIVEREYQLLQAKRFLSKGVTIIDPKRFDIRGNIEDIDIDPDVSIDLNVILVGKIKIGKGSQIGPNCYLKDTIVGNNVTILANTIIEGATIDSDAQVGPFARIRPNTTILNKAKIGNFVELKQANIGEHSKVNHLSYVGDADIASRVNFGAGSITCNYDGVAKHQTIIGDNVAIGAGCQLIAPITVEPNATIAAGTTLIKDAPTGKLTLNKKLQYSVTWQRPTKQNNDLNIDLAQDKSLITDK